MCVIVYTEINGKKILAKNRDSPYNPIVQVIHEVVNGIEVAYIKDKTSGWIEGMNSNGVGIINSTLSLNDRVKITDGNDMTVQKLKKKNNVIYNALVNETKNDETNLFDIISKAKCDHVVEGHSLLIHNDDIFHIENAIDNKFVVEKINKPTVYSNYGIRIKGEGFTKCGSGLSAFLRASIVKHELKENKINNEDELIDIMNKNYKNIKSECHPYRDKRYTIKTNKNIKHKRLIASTTGQILLNMTDKEFIYYTDINNSKYVEYINKLPREYIPKIRITIKETEKRLKHPQKIFTKKYLKKIYDRFDCSKFKTKKRKPLKSNFRKSIKM